MKLKVVLYIMVLFLVISTVSAHPGKLDKNGGHTCKTNCEKWGLKDGEYHYHNRPIPASAPTPEPTLKSTPTPTPTQTLVPTTAAPTRIAIPTPTSTTTVTSTSAPTPKPTLISIAALDPTEENRSVNYSTVKLT